MNLTGAKRQELNALFALNRKVFKAYLLKESLDRLWTYRYEGAMLRYLQNWIDQLRWQAAALPKASGDATEPPQRNLELLPDESAHGSGRGRQR